MTPRFSTNGEGIQFPAYGRKLQHTQGKDIGVFPAKDRLFDGFRGGFDYFTQYIPWQKEFRVWAFRRRPKALYEKVLSYPERARGVGANWRNGYAFHYVGEGFPDIREVGAKAVDALGLDFGAVDILLGVDNKAYVLEVNTAPGVEGPRHGLTALAESISRWVRNGFPRRNGDGRG